MFLPDKKRPQAEREQVMNSFEVHDLFMFCLRPFCGNGPRQKNPMQLYRGKTPATESLSTSSLSNSQLASKPGSSIIRSMF